MKLAIILLTIMILVGLASVALAQKRVKSPADNAFLDTLKDQLSTYTEQHAPERVYLQFDKPFYKPGETIWFQAYLRDENHLLPATKSQILHVEFINPKGNIDQSWQLITNQGTAAGNIDLAENMAGGLYKVKAYSNWQKNDQNALLFEKDIPIQAVVLPQLKMKLDFTREAYGPGDTVIAKLDLQSLANQALANHQFRFVVNLKGEKLLEKTATTDDAGLAPLQFQLPETLNTMDGLLNVVIPYQGQSESIARSIPIVLASVTLDLLPEGGELVQGLTSQVAFRALNEFAKPADIQGVVVDQHDTTITQLSSFHQGMGVFTLTPQPDTQYFVKITQPQGIKQRYPLPEALKKGYTLAVLPQANNSLQIMVRSTQPETLSLIAQVRGKVYYSQALKITNGEQRINIPTDDFPMGVAQITLFDAKKIERAERLVFVNKHKQLNINVTTDKQRYLPREKVSMTVAVSDERGIPLPATLSLAVTDDKLLSFADDKSGHILAKLLLEPDLNSDVYEPNFYFDEQEKEADQALDYLLMTQGWRRFQWQQVIDNPGFSPGHQAEDIILSGTVVSLNNQPVPEATVTVKSTGKSYLTDQAGRFVIRDLDLYEVQQLQASKGKLNSQPLWVNDYNEPLLLTLLDHRFLRPKRGFVDEVFELDDGMVPPPMPEAAGIMMAAPPEAEDEKRDMLFDFEQAEPQAIEPLDQRADQAVEAVIAEEIAAAPQEIMAAKPAPAKDMAMRQEKKMKMIMPQPLPEKKPVKYYRARLFPNVVYEKTQKVERRSDFRSTIFWQGDVKIDRNGKAHIEFYNSDEITAFRTTVEGIATDGLVGRQEHLHYTQLPFSMTVKVPAEITAGDELAFPLTLVNRTESTLHGALHTDLPQAWTLLQPIESQVSLSKGASKTYYPRVRIANKPGKDQLQVQFRSDTDQDAFTQTVNVVAQGFPRHITVSSQALEKEFVIKPEHVIVGTLQAKLTLYPTSLSNLLAGIESILRQPSGCFEQTSSSTYPNIMVLQYLQEHEVDEPNILTRANQLIKQGYQRLITYETQQQGYEWFGSTPPHEALTAYGLMEFADMQKVYSQVSDDMVKRTGDWLLSRRDEQGGFLRSAQALDSFGQANDAITNAYIVYALSEASYHFEILKQIEQAYQTAQQADDPYQLALVSNALFNIKDERAVPLLAKLLTHQHADDGHWDGKSHSITRSTGLALKIETTALAVLAILKASNQNPMILEKGVGFILASRSPHGGFANTQSTVLALKALTEYAKFAKRTAEPGTIEVYVNGDKVSDKSYPAGESEPIVLDNLAQYLKQGEQKIKVKYVGVKNPLPLTFAVNYHTNLPPSAEQTSVNVSTTLSDSSVAMGDTARLQIKISNLKAEGLPMSLVTVGIPAGMSPQPWQLKELQEKKVVDFYELIGNQVIFYYRQLEPSITKTINLDLKADIPGQYQGAASSAYLYYTDEHKHWVNGLSIEVKSP